MISRPHTVLQRMCRVWLIVSFILRRAVAARFAANFACRALKWACGILIWNERKSDMLYLIDSGAKLIKFVDRTFNIKRDYAMEIFEFLIANHRGCVFQFEITADIMRPEVLDYLSENAPPGIFRFEIGVQSTNDMTNELVQRRQNFIKLSPYGLEGEKQRQNRSASRFDRRTCRKRIITRSAKHLTMCLTLGPEELQLGFLKMLRGTGMRNDAHKYGYIYMDHAPYEILGNDICRSLI